MDGLLNLTLLNTSVSSTLEPLSSSSSSSSSYLSLPPSNLSSPVLPSLGLHHPLPAIIVAACLFFLFGGCVTFLAACCSSSTSSSSRTLGGCVAGESLSCGHSLSSEPQLKLWKRLGSVRRSFSAAPSFRRPPQRRQESKLSLQLAQDRSDLQAQLTIPCLLQYATEI